MTFTALFLKLLVWCAAHPAEVTMATGALCSCFVSKLDKYPRWHAAFSVLAHAGVNVPAVANAVSRLLTGTAVKALTVVALLTFPAAACAALTAQDRTELGTYEAQQDACIAATPSNKAAIDACRAQVRLAWCAKWAARFDAGVCQ